MSELNRVTRCRRWYELNVAALRYREWRRATNWCMGLIGATLMAVPRVLRLPFHTGTLFPEEVTIIWDVPIDEGTLPEELTLLGFRPLAALELPEFSGENLTCLLADEHRTTYCEVMQVRGEDQTAMSGISLTSYFADRRLKTVQSWQVAPLDQPENYLNRRVRGSLELAYFTHRQWLAEFAERPATTSRQHFIDVANAQHRRLGEYYAGRRLWLEAGADKVDALLRAKGLFQPADGPDRQRFWREG